MQHLTSATQTHERTKAVDQHMLLLCAPRTRSYIHTYNIPTHEHTYTFTHICIQYFMIPLRRRVDADVLGVIPDFNTLLSRAFKYQLCTVRIVVMI